MSNFLATINNNAAAKRAAFKKTPYVPWNRAEVLEKGFLDRLPRLTSHKTPNGWERVDSWTISQDYHAGTLADIDAVLSTAKVTLGFAFIDDLIAVYKPLPEAHEPDKSETR
jgi:hypothetical protein